MELVFRERLSHLSADSQLFYALAQLKEQTFWTVPKDRAGQGKVLGTEGVGTQGRTEHQLSRRCYSQSTEFQVTKTQAETGLAKDAFWKGPGVDEKRVNLVDP